MTAHIYTPPGTAVGRTIEKAALFTGNAALGVGESVKDTVVGLVTLPVTLYDLGGQINENGWEATGGAIKDGLSKSGSEWWADIVYGAPETRARAIGQAIGLGGEIMIGSKGLSRIGSVNRRLKMATRALRPKGQVQTGNWAPIGASGRKLKKMSIVTKHPKDPLKPAIHIWQPVDPFTSSVGNQIGFKNIFPRLSQQLVSEHGGAIQNLKQVLLFSRHGKPSGFSAMSTDRTRPLSIKSSIEAKNRALPPRAVPHSRIRSGCSSKIISW